MVEIGVPEQEIYIILYIFWKSIFYSDSRQAAPSTATSTAVCVIRIITLYDGVKSPSSCCHDSQPVL